MTGKQKMLFLFYHAISMSSVWLCMVKMVEAVISLQPATPPYLSVYGLKIISGSDVISEDILSLIMSIAPTLIVGINGSFYGPKPSVSKLLTACLILVSLYTWMAVGSEFGSIATTGVDSEVAAWERTDTLSLVATLSNDRKVGINLVRHITAYQILTTVILLALFRTMEDRHASLDFRRRQLGP